MKKIIYTTLLIAMFTTVAFSQQLTQTLRGTIIDMDSQLPLIGVSVRVIGDDKFYGAATDVNGEFRVEKIMVGRITLQLSYMGYETKTIPDIEVNTGNEKVLNLTRQNYQSFMMRRFPAKSVM